MGVIAAGLVVLVVGGAAFLLARHWTEMRPHRHAPGGGTAGAPAVEVELPIATRAASLTFRIERAPGAGDAAHPAAGNAAPPAPDTSDASRLVLRDGRTTVDLDAIPDPDDRRRARDIVARLLGGAEPRVGAQDLLWLAGLLSRK